MAIMRVLSRLRYESYVSLEGWTRGGTGISGVMVVRAESHLGRWKKDAIGLLIRSAESGMHQRWAVEIFLAMYFALRMVIF